MTESRCNNIRSKARCEKQSSSVACQTPPGGQFCADPSSTDGSERARNVHDHKMQQGVGKAGNSLSFVDSAPRKKQSYRPPVRQNSEHHLPGHDILVYRRSQASCDDQHASGAALLMPRTPMYILLWERY
ncbi:hypothetical protein BsWGS_25867 [Bradybaena similaris]